MSGVELAGFLIGLLGPLEQSINITNILRNHCKSFGENETVIQQLITFLSHLQHDLKQLQRQLEKHESSIPQSNYKIIETQFLQMKAKFEEAQTSLIKMNQSAGRNIKHFFKASKWSEKCKHILTELQETQQGLRDVNIFLGSNEVSKKNIDTATRKIIQTVEAHGAPSSSTQSTDEFQPHSQKLSISYGAVPDFESTDSQGNLSTIEGKLKQRLIGTNTHTKIFSVLGPGGVGKTTTIHMLTHNEQLREYFHDGVYYIKLGANAKIESVIDSLADIVRKSGGASKESEIQACKSVEKAIEIGLAWLMNRKYLVLVDDVWDQNGLGESLLLSLKGMISASDEGGMAFTTRDPCIATRASETFRLECRKPQGTESRAILFQHARQKLEPKYGENTERIIKKLLGTCGGLPVAHSVVGNGVYHLSMRQGVTKEDAWRLYSCRQHNVLRGNADEYPTLHNVFDTALCLLQEESVENKKRKRDAPNINYRHIHRSFCVLEKQQLAPIDILGCLWNVESEDETREICENFVRVGLAAWHHLQVTDTEGIDLDVECVSLHDLIHDFATEEAKREKEIVAWHRRIVNECATKRGVSNSTVPGCRQWWKMGELEYYKDGGYLIRNICRHFYHEGSDENDLVTLVTRPEWIRLQLCNNGLLQYESDVEYGMRWMQLRKRNGMTNGERGMKELEMIRDAVRLSTSHIWKNKDETWFQLYGRLMKWGKSSESMTNYLKYFEENYDTPWLRPIENTEGMLISVGSVLRSVIDVDRYVSCMVFLPGGEEVVCGCGNGELMVVNLKSNIVKKRWAGHDECIHQMAICEKENFVITVTNTSWKIWEVGNWRLMNTPSNQLGSINTVATSKDGSVFMCTTLDGCFCVWSITRTKSPQRLLTHECEDKWCCGTEMIVRKNGNEIILFNGTLEHVQIYKIENGNVAEHVAQETQLKYQYERKDLINCYSSLLCMDVSTDESKMISAHADGSLQLWDITTMTPIDDPWDAHAASIACVSFNRDSTRIVFGDDDGTIQVRNVKTRELVCAPFPAAPNEADEVQFIEIDNTIISSGLGKIRIWNIDEFSGDVAKEPVVDDVTWVTCSADQSRFVTGDKKGRLTVWNAANGKLIRQSVHDHENYIRCVAVTANFRWIISVGEDKMVKLIDWNTLELKNKWKGHKSWITFVEISKNQEFVVTTSWDKTIRIWDLIKCDGTHSIIEGNSWVYRCFISDDDKRIITINDDDSISAKVWDIEARQFLRKNQLEYHTSREETLRNVGETCANAEEKKVFVRHFFALGSTKMIRYGTALNSDVLGTTESGALEKNYSSNTCVYSTRHEMVALLNDGRLNFLKLHL